MVLPIDNQVLWREQNIIHVINHEIVNEKLKIHRLIFNITENHNLIQMSKIKIVKHERQDLFLFMATH